MIDASCRPYHKEGISAESMRLPPLQMYFKSTECLQGQWKLKLCENPMKKSLEYY